MTKSKIAKRPRWQPSRLLQSRAETAEQLGYSTDTVKDLEAAGYLTAIRLSRSKQARVHHEPDEVHRLVRGLASGEIVVDMKRRKTRR